MPNSISSTNATRDLCSSFGSGPWTYSTVESSGAKYKMLSILLATSNALCLLNCLASLAYWSWTASGKHVYNIWHFTVIPVVTNAPLQNKGWRLLKWKDCLGQVDKNWKQHLEWATDRSGTMVMKASVGIQLIACFISSHEVCRSLFHSRHFQSTINLEKSELFCRFEVPVVIV